MNEVMRKTTTQLVSNVSGTYPVLMRAAATDM